MKGLIQYPETPPKRWLPASTPGYFFAIEHICRNMREEEQLQHLLVMGADPNVDKYDPIIAARSTIALGGTAHFYVADDGHTPVAAGGYIDSEAMPGVWQSWMMATDEGWEKYWRDLTRGTRWLMAQLLDGGARRLETTLLASRTKAHVWHTDFLGMKLEGSRRRFFRNGEDLLLYAMTDQDWLERWTERETPVKEAA